MSINTKVINLFAGPGTGKSTTAAALFSLMKWQKKNVQLVQEYAKQICWEQNYDLLNDQLWITANQCRRISRLIGKVDYIITDSPVLIGYAYCDKNDKELLNLIVSRHNKQNNLNIFLNRKKQYNPKGRVQTEQQAKDKDNEILNILKELKIDYKQIDSQFGCQKEIYKII